MGLDITAYSRLVLIGQCESYEEYDNKYWDGRGRTCYIDEQRGFHERLAPLTDKSVYRIEGEMFEFRAGSYTGYSHWRDILAAVFVNATAREVWRDPDLYRDAPFYELINFSDCEYCIGSESAARLATAFDLHDTRALAVSDPRFYSTYDHFRRAFRLAADNGVVMFS